MSGMDKTRAALAKAGNTPESLAAALARMITNPSFRSWIEYEAVANDCFAQREIVSNGERYLPCGVMKHRQAASASDSSKATIFSGRLP